MRVGGYILSTALAAAAVLAGCGPRGTGPVDPALAGFIPGDANVLAGVRLDQIRATPLGKQLADAGLLEPPGVEAHDLIACWDGKNWLVAARGKLRAPSTPGLASVGDVVLAGPPDSVRAAIARHAAKRRPPRELIDRARTLPAGSQIWAVTYGAPALPPAGERLSSTQRLINAMEDITASANLRSGIQAAATGNCLDERNARVVEETVRAMIGLGGQMLARGDQDLLRAYEGIRVERQGRAVRLEAAVPGDAAQKMLSSLIRR
ncbi:MAG TPA: hypothetical protein VN442_03500 [Bryobacteraceae bacterium]|nr:hypothetical protein [Bryobacteraceae bacterium]